jgi:exonuclease SbcC
MGPFFLGTSILEAIAWVLFDHKGITVEELICNGVSLPPSSAEMISSRDQRTYRIKRCTRSGYNIYDPKLAKLFPHSKPTKFFPWLRSTL